MPLEHLSTTTLVTARKQTESDIQSNSYVRPSDFSTFRVVVVCTQARHKPSRGFCVVFRRIQCHSHCSCRLAVDISSIVGLVLVLCVVPRNHLCASWDVCEKGGMYVCALEKSTGNQDKQKK